MKLSDIKLKASHLSKGMWTPVPYIGTGTVDPASYPSNRENFVFEVTGLALNETLNTLKGPIGNGDFAFFNSDGDLAGVTDSGIKQKSWFVVDDTYYPIAGEALLIDTQTNGAFTVYLPFPAAPYDIVSIAPVYPSFVAEPLTIAGNGNNIMGTSDDVLLNQNNISLEFIFIDEVFGWAMINSGQTNFITVGSGGSAALVMDITQANAGVFDIGTELPDTAIVTGCKLLVTTPYSSGPASLKIGTSLVDDIIAGTGLFNLLSADIYEVGNLFKVNGILTNKQMKGTMVAGVGTFSATILIDYKVA